MIENQEQLATTLAYIAKWADALEGMRQYELEAMNGLFPSLAAGPLSEIRKNIVLAQAYANRETENDAAVENSGKAKQNDFATARMLKATADSSK